MQTQDAQHDAVLAGVMPAVAEDLVQIGNGMRVHLARNGRNGLFRCSEGLVVCIHLNVGSSIFRFLDQAVEDGVCASSVLRLTHRHPVDDGSSKSDVETGWRAVLLCIRTPEELLPTLRRFYEVLHRIAPMQVPDKLLRRMEGAFNARHLAQA